MNAIDFAEGPVSALITVAGIILSAIISLTIYMLSGRKGRRDSLTAKFDQTYKNAFIIKDKIEEKNLLPTGNQFFFELDYMMNIEGVREAILDYVTEVENYFAVVLGKYRLDSSFIKLSSFALYSRWSSLYGFVLKMRQKNKSKKMFDKFVTVVNKMETMDKVKARIALPEELYYVGIRGSDCTAKIYGFNHFNRPISKEFFKGSVTMFPEKNAFPRIRPNHNMNVKNFLPYVEGEMNKIIGIAKAGNSKIFPKFMFYNPATAHKLSPRLKEHVICLNEQTLLDGINDKILCRNWLLQNGIPIISFRTMTGQEINAISYNKLCHTDACVIQSNYGGGGIGTYLFNARNFDELKRKLNPLGRYIVSQYMDNSISVNTHIFISEKQTVLSPGSIQIIETVDNQLCYRGADFIAFKSISVSVREKVRDESIKIANLLRNVGYRGVAGIDFIISADDNVYCSEINPRFQASSALLDLYLAKNQSNGLASSVFELNCQAFNNALKSDLDFEDDIGFSCHYYYDDGKPINYFAQKADLMNKTAFRLDADGVAFDNEKIGKDSYLFRVVFDHQICAISPDNTIWINDNIRVENAPADLWHLKVALLNQGVRLENAPDDIKEGSYESVDILLDVSDSEEFDENVAVDVNCAVGINLAKYSPFVLDCRNGKLLYYVKIIGKFIIEKELPTTISELSRKILYMSADRIRIKIVSGCEFKNYGSGCKFCDLPFSEIRFSLQQIEDALRQLRDSGIDFRHILIGGGTCLDKDIWEEIIALVEFLKSEDYFKNKPISLMSILPPAEGDILRRLKTAGIEEVAFNLEIANANLAEKMMPGKCRDKDSYYNGMKKAIDIFGIGSVRSALIVGLDRTEDIVNEVLTMAKNGIMPCLSALRALRKASANFKIHPSNDYLIDVYEKCKNTLDATSYEIKTMGPPCKRCRNNMLIE